jgi:hypothetical protein
MDAFYKWAMDQFIYWEDAHRVEDEEDDWDGTWGGKVTFVEFPAREVFSHLPCLIWSNFDDPRARLVEEYVEDTPYIRLRLKEAVRKGLLVEPTLACLDATY